METRICKTCNEEKDCNQYYTTSSGNLRSACKKCHKESNLIAERKRNAEGALRYKEEVSARKLAKRTATHKLCPRCKIDKKAEDYTRHKSTARLGELCVYCKTCQNEISKNYRDRESNTGVLYKRRMLREKANPEKYAHREFDKAKHKIRMDRYRATEKSRVVARNRAEVRKTECPEKTRASAVKYYEANKEKVMAKMSLLKKRQKEDLEDTYIRRLLVGRSKGLTTAKELRENPEEFEIMKNLLILQITLIRNQERNKNENTNNVVSSY
jgi:hypothetical protein